MRSSRTAAIGIFAGVGSRHESPTLHGASHFLEHVLFKGTPTRTAEEISAAIESVGGELNAYTAKEHTCFYARVLHTDTGRAVDVLADMIANSLVTTADINAERAVILDEIAMHADDPSELVSEIVAAEVLAGNRIGQQVIGSPDSIAAMNRAQIVRHWRRYYQPPSLVVAAAGRVDHDHLVEQLTGLDDHVPASVPRPTPKTKIIAPGGVVTREIRLEQVSAVLAFPAGGTFDESRYALGLLSVVIGGGMASRLFVEVREKRGLTYGIDAGETAYSDAGLWTVEWQCGPDRLADILAVVRDTLDDVAANGVTETELERAKGQMRGQTVLSYEGPSSRMSRLGINTLLGDTRTLAEVLTAFDGVTAEEIQREAAALFSRPSVLGLVGPRVPARSLKHWTP
jgi:predicted Zn-dependent peptidase